MLSKLIHLLVPHHSNNHKPKVLHHTSLAILATMLIASHSLLNLAATLAPQILGFASQISPDRIVTLTNQKRAEAGLQPVTLDPKLSDAARRKAADMFNNNYWAHTSPNGTKPWYFITSAGYSYLHAGENLARDFTNPEDVVKAWVASQTHRDNLLSSRYQNIGVAVVDGQLDGKETTIVVQMFGTSQSFTPQVASAEKTSIIPPAIAQEEVVREVVETGPIPEPTPTLLASIDPTPAFNTFTITKIISLSFILLLIIVLAIDWYVAWRKNLIRLSGRNWAHLTYLGVIAILSLVIKQGLIL